MAQAAIIKVRSINKSKTEQKNHKGYGEGQVQMHSHGMKELFCDDGMVCVLTVVTQTYTWG